MLLRFLEFIGWPVLVGLFVAAVILSINFWPSSNTSDKWQGPVSYAAAVRKAAPSVVNIFSRRQVVQRSRNPIIDDPIIGKLVNAKTPRTREAISLGSGVIMSYQGHILTNAHVVGGAEQIHVQLHDGRTGTATLVGTDKNSDLAVLKINLTNLTPIETSDSMLAEVGQVVLAIGNPHGVGQTVTQGIVSAVGHKRFGSEYRESIQTDAAINPGNSGGALVNAYGKLIGINNATLSNAKTHQKSSYGISFAIPTNDAIKVLNDIREHGFVRRGYIGDVVYQTWNQRQMRAMGLDYNAGLKITSIDQGSPASSADLRVGDVIIGINHKRRTDAAYVSQIFFDLAPEDVLTVEVVRNGRELTLEIIATIAPSIAQ